MAKGITIVMKNVEGAERKEPNCFTYQEKVNGSLANIAGICNEQGNVLGMMPHPERAMEELLGSTDGRSFLLQSLKLWKGIKPMMNEPTPKEIKETRLYAEWGLTDEEYHQIETILQREPNYTETGLFSVMWSEHCSYKIPSPF